MIRAIIFDFDGTLVQSSAIKRRVFFEVASRYDQGVELMTEVYAQSELLDRYEIFNRFAKRIDASKNGEDLGAKLAEEYSERCRSLICEAPEVPGAKIALTELRAADVRVFISSATPTPYLLDLVKARGLCPLVEKAFGGPKSKIGHIAAIANVTSYKSNEMLYVGDSLSDYQSASAKALQFVGISERRSQIFPNEVPTIVNLVGFLKYVRERHGLLK